MSPKQAVATPKSTKQNGGPKKGVRCFVVFVFRGWRIFEKTKKKRLCPTQAKQLPKQTQVSKQQIAQEAKEHISKESKESHKKNMAKYIANHTKIDTSMSTSWCVYQGHGLRPWVFGHPKGAMLSKLCLVSFAFWNRLKKFMKKFGNGNRLPKKISF